MNPEQKPFSPNPTVGSQPIATQLPQPATNETPIAPLSSVQTAPPVVLTPQRPSRQKKLAILLILSAMALITVAIAAYILSRNDTNKTISSSDNSQTVAEDKDKTKEDDKTSSLSQAEVDELHKFNVAKFSSAIGLYWADNTGNLPSIDDIDSKFMSKYLSGDFNDPSKNSPYIVVDNDPTTGEMQYKTRASCGNANTVSAGNERQAVIRVLLSSGAYYCMDY